jgi:hypothetical protein
MKAFVIRATDPEEVHQFFHRLGLTFAKEKHGSGPEHYACEQNGVVFEIYPATKNNTFQIKDFLTPAEQQSKS